MIDKTLKPGKDKYEVTRFSLFKKRIYGLPNEKTVEQIADFINKNATAVISIGAGTGVWEKLISEKTSINIYAVDKNPPTDLYYKVEKMEVPSNDFTDYVKNKNINTVFSSWPDFESSMVTDAIDTLVGAGNPVKYLIYIGEDEGGYTGDDKLFSLLKKSKVVEKITYDNKDQALGDSCTIYELVD